MSVTIDSALTERVAAIQADIAATEAAHAPLEQEVAAEVAHLDVLAAKAETSPSVWLGTDPSFHTTTFSDSVLGILALVAPDKVREIAAARARARGASWRGLRMSEGEKMRKLGKLQADLRAARARLEQCRREVEEQTGQMQPRVNDDPAVWLLPPQQLAELAATTSGRKAP